MSSHPEKLLRKVLVVVDRITLRREGQKLSLLEPGTKVSRPSICTIASCRNTGGPSMSKACWHEIMSATSFVFFVLMLKSVLHNLTKH